MNQPSVIPIGVLAKRSGITVETIRYYERLGLLVPTTRTSSSYRMYDPAASARLMFIKRARELGFTLDQVASLLSLSGKAEPCAAASDLASRHLRDVQEKINDLIKIAAILSATLAACDAGNSDGCPLINALANATR
jgi:MerR family mercuric resistance operon transcriptional regulator